MGCPPEHLKRGLPIVKARRGEPRLRHSWLLHRPTRGAQPVQPVREQELSEHRVDRTAPTACRVPAAPDGPDWRVMSSQGAYRLGDGSPVTSESARAIWTAVAREVLEEVRGATSMPYSELA